MYLSQDNPNIIQVWNTKPQQYINHGQIPEETKTLIEHVTTMKTHTVQDQLMYLSNISNYHWWQYIKCDGTKHKSGIHVRLTDHLLYHPSCEESDEVLKLKYLPVSPRNRLMYFQYTQHSGNLNSIINHLLKLDSNQHSIIEMNPSEEHHQPKKH